MPQVVQKSSTSKQVFSYVIFVLITTLIFLPTAFAGDCPAGYHRTMPEIQRDNSLATVCVRDSSRGRIFWGGSPSAIGFSYAEGSSSSGSADGKGTEPQKCGNPIMVQSGNKIQYETDYVGKGEFPLTIKRTYNKAWVGTYKTGVFNQLIPNSDKGLFGKKWLTNYGHKLFFIYNYDSNDCNVPRGSLPPAYCSTPPIITEVIALRPDGTKYKFTYNSNLSVWQDYKTESVQELKQVGGEWVLTTESEFVERYDSSGKVTKRTSPTGIYHIFSYSGVLLTEVLHSSGRKLTFTRSGGQLTRITTEKSYFDYTYTNGYLGSMTRAGTPSFRKDYYYEDSRYPDALTKIRVNNRDFAHYTYHHDGRGASTYHQGDVGKFSFDYGSLSTTVTNPLGHQSTYRYKSVGGRAKLDKIDRVAATYCPAASSNVTYDSFGYVDRKTDWQGNVTDFDYNAKGQLVKQTLALGTSSATVLSYQWLAGENKIKEQTNADSKVVYDYSTNGRLNSVEVTNLSAYGNYGETRKTSYTYITNSKGIVTRRTVDGPRTDVNDITTYDFNFQGNLTKITNALGQVSNFSLYDSAGNVGRITDPNGLQTNLIYDKADRVLSKSIINSSGTQTTSYQYNGIGKLDKVTYPDSSSLTLVYDSAHRHIKTLNDSDEVLTYGYTKNSDISATVISKQSTKTVFPCEEDLTGASLKLSKFPPKIGDKCDPYTTTIETDYFAKYTEYDSMARVHKTAGNNSQQTVYGYDNNSNVKSITDGSGRTTNMTYNALNQLINSTARDGGLTRYSYNAAGRLNQVIDARGLSTRYFYNGFGDLMILDSPDTGMTHFTYNQAGQILSKQRNDGSVTTYSYDALGRVKTESYPNGSKSFIYDSGTYGKGRLYKVTDTSGSTTFTYDKVGNVTQKNSLIGARNFNTYYAFNNMNRITQMTYPSGHKVNYGYNSLGKVSNVTYQNGSTIENVATNLLYRPFGPLYLMSHGNGAVRRITHDLDYRPTKIYTKGIQNLDYLYDSRENISKITNSQVGSLTQTYGYDNESRLTNVTSNSGNHTYSYDKVGNRKTHNSDNLGYSNTSNRLTSWNSSTVSYNANGQITSKAGAIFTYNGNNRLSNYQKNGQTTNYLYNALGQRVKKSGVSTTNYLYGEQGQLIAEHDSAGTVQKEYIYLHGQVIAMIKNNARYYVHNDHLGRAERITNRNKSTVWLASNYAFDRDINSNSIGDYNLGFSGQYYDSESGNNYNYYRDYDPSSGRYLQSDPIGLAGGANTYGYVNSNPVSYADRYGLAVSVGAALGGCALRFGAGFLAGDGLRNAWDSYGQMQSDRISAKKSDCDNDLTSNPNQVLADAAAKVADGASAFGEQLARGIATVAILNMTGIDGCTVLGGIVGWVEGEGRLSNYIDDQMRSFSDWAGSL